MVAIIYWSLEEKTGLLPGLPVRLRRHIVTTGVGSNGIAGVFQAVFIHGLKILIVVNGPRLRCARWRQRSANDNRVGVSGLDGHISQLEQCHVAGRVQFLVAPFVVQVLLVPNFVGFHPALVASRHSTQELREFLRVDRRPFHSEVRVGRPRPFGRFHHAEHRF